MTGLVSYGGDSQITVARSEIERITSSLSGIQTRLIDELQPLAQLHGLVHHLQLDLHLPETLVRLGLQRHGCFVASESYFSGDARVAHQLQIVSDALHFDDFASNLSAGLATLPHKEISILERPPSAVMQAPSSLAGFAGRLNNKSGNIRIESYQTAVGKLVVMYLPGTSEWNPLAGKKAFDVRSDVELIGDGKKSTSFRAANAALNACGISSKDQLILVGYSQGGMVAAELAQTHSNTIGMVTFGSPIANEQVPSTLAVLSIEHTNDLVPALSGRTNPLTENWTTASRHLELQPGETFIAAHQMRNYADTAGLADKSSDTGLVRIRERILAPLAGAELLETREFEPLKVNAKP